MIKACKELIKKLNPYAKPCGYLYHTLKPILVKLTKKHRLTPDIDTDTEFKATWKYGNILIATAELKYAENVSTFSFKILISGYIAMNGFSGELQPLKYKKNDGRWQISKCFKRSNKGIIEENEYYLEVKFEAISDTLELLIQAICGEISQFRSIVHDVKRIQEDSQCIPTEVQNDPAEGVFITTGSSGSFEFSFTIKNKECTGHIKSKRTNQEAQTCYSMDSTPSGGVYNDIIHHIQELLLKDCLDILNKIERNTHVSIPTPTYPTKFSRTEFQCRFTYRRDTEHRLDICIEPTFDAKPCIVLSITTHNELKWTKEDFTVFYQQPTAPKKGCITIDEVERVSNEHLDKFFKDRHT